MGITALAHRHLQDLSGGQRQRVFVAQGLAQEHDILLLDEPLTGIDLPTAQAIDDVIHDETGRGRFEACRRILQFLAGIAGIAGKLSVDFTVRVNGASHLGTNPLIFLKSCNLAQILHDG